MLPTKGMDLSEVIADAVRREVDFKRIVRELAMVAYGLPKYRWIDESGRTSVSHDPPAEQGRYVVTAHVPDVKEQAAAAKRLMEMGTGGKQLRIKHEGLAPQRTAIDQWLDTLPAEQLQRMIGTRPEPAYLEVEALEDTVPAEPTL